MCSVESVPIAASEMTTFKAMGRLTREAMRPMSEGWPVLRHIASAVHPEFLLGLRSLTQVRVVTVYISAGMSGLGEMFLLVWSLTFLCPGILQRLERVQFVFMCDSVSGPATLWADVAALVHTLGLLVRHSVAIGPGVMVTLYRLTRDMGVSEAFAQAHDGTLSSLGEALSEFAAGGAGGCMVSEYVQIVDGDKVAREWSM